MINRTLEKLTLIATSVLVAVMVIFVMTCNQGCFTSVEQLRSVPYAEWTAEDCMAVIMRNVHHNLKRDGEIISALVIPFTPEVVKAIGRYRQIKYAHSDSLTYEFVQRLTQQGTGTFLDRDGMLWDAQGNRFIGRRDSLMVMVSLINTTWPCEPLSLNGIPIMNMSETPCETPDISNLDQHIFLSTATGDTLYPKTLFGRRNNILTDDENLLIVFDLRGVENQATLLLHINAFNKFNNREMTYGF